MKLEHLTILDAVVKAGSFARAANEILLISQPAVSAAIRRLEEHLGFLLFDRESYRPVLTEQGQAFYARARQLLDSSQALEQYAELLASGTEPELKLAVDPNCLVPELLKVFKAQTHCFGQTHFEFINEQLGGSAVRLMQDEAQLALITWAPSYYQSLPFEHERLFRFQMSTLVAPDYPLLQGEQPLPPEALKDAVQIVQRTNERYLPSGVFGQQYSARRWYVHDQETKRQLIQAGLGFGALPHLLVRQELEQGLLVPFENLPGFGLIVQEVHLVRRKDRPHGPVANGLWQAFRAMNLPDI